MARLTHRDVKVGCVKNNVCLEHLPAYASEVNYACPRTFNINTCFCNTKVTCSPDVHMDFFESLYLNYHYTVCVLNNILRVSKQQARRGRGEHLYVNNASLQNEPAHS